MLKNKIFSRKEKLLNINDHYIYKSEIDDITQISLEIISNPKVNKCWSGREEHSGPYTLQHKNNYNLVQNNRNVLTGNKTEVPQDTVTILVILYPK